jgi:hypothetical protein
MRKPIVHKHYLLFFLRVYFHVFADDNGANATLTAAQIETDLQVLLLLTALPIFVL